MTEYLKCASKGDFKGMIKAKASGTDVHAIDEHQRNAYLIGAIRSDIKVMVQAKIDGVDINAVDKHGYNAYLLAALYNSTEVMENMLGNYHTTFGNCDVHQLDIDGKNAFLIAAESYSDGMKQAKKDGVNINAVDANGKGAFDLLKSHDMCGGCSYILAELGVVKR